MGTIFLYLTLCTWGAADQCREVRQQPFATASACYQEGARRVAANRANVSGHFMFIECREVGS